MKAGNENAAIITSLLPCGGMSGAGQTGVKAAIEFSQQGNCELLSIAELAVGNSPFPSPEMEKLVVIDGCQKKCGLTFVQNADVCPDSSLCLADLGIEHRPDSTDVDDEEVVLARDGIEACCNEVGDIFPRIGGCSCR